MTPEIQFDISGVIRLQCFNSNDSEVRSEITNHEVYKFLHSESDSEVHEI